MTENGVQMSKKLVEMRAFLPKMTENLLFLHFNICVNLGDIGDFAAYCYMGSKPCGNTSHLVLQGSL